MSETPLLDTVGQDVRYSVRLLWRSKSFTPLPC